MALGNGRPIPLDVLTAMETAAKARGHPYSDVTKQILLCKECWVTPTDASGRPCLKPEQVTGKFFITPCERHAAAI